MVDLGNYRSYVKPIFGDLWDQYQLKVVSHGGNKKFWDFLKDYKSEQKIISTKYETKEAKFYARRLAAITQERPFVVNPPPKNMDEYLDKGADLSKQAVKKTGEAFKSIGSTIDNKFNKWFK